MKGQAVIRAHVVLKGPAGGVSSSGPTSKRDVPAALPDPSVREKIKQSLTKLGFAVQRVSALSIIVEAPAEVFETVFDAPLLRRELSDADQDKPEPAASGPARQWVSWSKQPTIPTEMDDAVETVVFPQPTARMAPGDP